MVTVARIGGLGRINEKVAHVRRSRQTRVHSCHWPGCDRQVPPAAWGCRPHWYQLPRDLRSRIWRAYRIGQEVDGRPSPAYLAVAREAQEWIAKWHGPGAEALRRDRRQSELPL